MNVQALLAGLAGGVFAILGAIHIFYTLRDINRPRIFAPNDDSVRIAMLSSTVRLSRGRTSMWDTWLGLNISHGLGAAIFGVAAIVVASGVYGAPNRVTLLAFTIISAVYLATAVRFWFYKPIAGTALATLLFLLAFVLSLTNE